LRCASQRFRRAQTARDTYGDVTVKAMAQAMERIPRVEV
jgi:hypothetical protein